MRDCPQNRCHKPREADHDQTVAPGRVPRCLTENLQPQAEHKAGSHREKEIEDGVPFSEEEGCAQGDHHEETHPDDHFSCIETNDLEIGQPRTHNHDFFLPLLRRHRACFISRDKNPEWRSRDRRP